MYGTELGFNTYLAERGLALATAPTSAQITGALARGSLFVDGLGYRDTGTGTRTSFWPGTPASGSQINEWPRTGAEDIYGNAIDNATVPTRVEYATYEVAFFALGGGDINPAQRADQRVVREKFDVIEFQYADVGGNAEQLKPAIPAVMDLLAPLITGGGGNPYGITLVATS